MFALAWYRFHSILDIVWFRWRRAGGLANSIVTPPLFLSPNIYSAFYRSAQTQIFLPFKGSDPERVSTDFDFGSFPLGKKLLKNMDPIRTREINIYSFSTLIGHFVTYLTYLFFGILQTLYRTAGLYL